MRQSWTNIEASPSTPSKINIADALEISLADGTCNLQTAATTMYAHVRIGEHIHLDTSITCTPGGNQDDRSFFSRIKPRDDIANKKSLKFASLRLCA